ncbi:hypothetical protein GGR51DRAFT_176199 [Nemania sp. FL0031]|nr:hypothetical protein GGR51DRAFT_176199 [Nemania sp. FL0031]
MAKQRNSRADDARVQDMIRLIKSLPTIRRTLVTNPIRKLTPSQYKQLLSKIQDSDNDFADRLRFEYTHSKQLFEIRMSTHLHEGVVAECVKRFSLWQVELGKSTNSAISRAAEPLYAYGRRRIKTPLNGGVSDVKSPDNGIAHECSHNQKCKSPALVFEVEFSNNDRDALKEKAEAYIIGSKGEIRTVIAVYMGEMRKAERKNERRLRKMYRTGQVDESGLYSYPRDEENITGEASILIWRATVMEDNTVGIGRFQEKKFRGATGNAIQSTSLRIPLEDCVCKHFIDSAKRSKAPPLEISSEALCRVIKRDLELYREDRASEIKDQVKEAKQKKINEEKENNQREEERLRGATQRQAREGVGVFGRFMERGRLFSARVRDRRFQREPE